MAVAADATGGLDGAGLNPSWTHTVGAISNGALYVVLAYWTATSGAYMTGVTFNGVALTMLRRNQNSGGAWDTLEIWRLLNPASGAHSVAVTGDMGGSGGAISKSFSGVDQTTPEGTSSMNDQSTGVTSSTLSVTVPTNGGAIDGMVTASTTAPSATGGANQTSIHSAVTNGETDSSSLTTTAGSVSLSWSFTSATCTQIVFPINASAGAADPFPAAYQKWWLRPQNMRQLLTRFSLRRFIRDLNTFCGSRRQSTFQEQTA